KTDQVTSNETPDSSNSADINWKVKIADLQLNKNHISYYDANQPKLKKGMDYGHLDFTDLDVELDNFFFSIDSISGQLERLNFTDRSGLAVNRLETDFSYTNQGATLEKLYLETPNTLIKNYARVHYASLETITDNIGAIQLEANIEKSKLGMKDVLLLVPDLDTMEVMKPLLTQTFFIHGKINGRVDNLTIPNIEFSTLDQTHLHASAHLKGLPDIDRFYMDLQLKNFTSGKRDMERLIAKSMLPDSIDLPNR